MPFTPAPVTPDSGDLASTCSSPLTLPTILLLLRQSELGEDAIGELLDNIPDALGAEVKCGHRGHYGRASVMHAQHILKMHAIERGLAQAQNHRPTFLQANVGGTSQKIFGYAGGD
jgi:hypothetical protein